MSENACIICIDDGIEPLLQNNSCKCNYRKHISCWEKYSQTTTPLKCPMCRKVLNSKTPLIRTIPSAPPAENDMIEYTILPEIVISPSRQITNSYQNATPITASQVTPVRQQLTIVPQQNVLWETLNVEQKKQRIIKAILIGIVFGIIMFVILYFIL